MNLNII